MGRVLGKMQPKNGEFALGADGSSRIAPREARARTVSFTKRPLLWSVGGHGYH